VKIGTRCRVARTTSAPRLDWPPEIIGSGGEIIDDGDEVSEADAAEDPGVVHVRVHGEYFEQGGGECWYIHESDLEVLS
jgi:hypothetical protein